MFFLREEPEAGQEAHRRPGVYICDECIDLCNEIIEEELSEGAELGLEELPKPREIYEFLNGYVIGQERQEVARGSRLQPLQARAGLLLLVPSGTSPTTTAPSEVQHLVCPPRAAGKTYLAQTLAPMLNVPFAIADATALHRSGICRGGCREHPARADPGRRHGYQLRTPRPALSISTKSTDGPQDRKSVHLPVYVSGEGVQQALLKILEGTIANVPPARPQTPAPASLLRSTTNILFHLRRRGLSGLSTHSQAADRGEDPRMFLGEKLPTKEERYMYQDLLQVMPRNSS